MESTGDPSIDLATIGAVIVFCLGLVVGIGGMWLAWRMVRRLPADDNTPPPPSETRPRSGRPENSPGEISQREAPPSNKPVSGALDDLQ